MLRVMITDDEAIEREGLKLMLSRECPDIEVVGEAENGRRAIKLAEELKPDLILMDIKMPGIDGVEAVKKIKEKLPAMKFIMVSAFDTFEYARGVMQQGVKEYLLKPSRKGEVIEAIRRVEKELVEERSQQNEHLQLKKKFQRSLSFVQSEWLHALLMNHVQELTVEEWQEFLEIDALKGYAVVFKLTGSALEKKTKTEAYSALKHEVQNENAAFMTGPMMGDQVPVFMFFSEKSASLSAEIVTTVKELIYSFQRKFPSLKLFAGIGSFYEGTEALIQSYHHAIMALERVQIDRSNPYVLYHEKMKETVHERNLFQQEKKLIAALEEGDQLEVEKKFDSYFAALLETFNGEVKSIKHAIEELFIIIKRFLKEMGLHIKQSSDFTVLETALELQQAAKSQLSYLTKELKNFQTSETASIIYKAKAYIENHYSEPLSLEEVSDYVSLSPYYFSKLFKEESGITFIDYVTEFRVKKAKELLRNHSLNLKEICFDVGYKDPNYFSRVFKKKVGISPSEYRTRVLEML